MAFNASPHHFSETLVMSQMTFHLTLVDAIFYGKILEITVLIAYRNAFVLYVLLCFTLYLRFF